jgi:uncharacterized membrane protein YhaH (DUF805 family)
LIRYNSWLRTLQKLFIKNFFSFSGRANRKEFIIFQIIYICLNICLILPLYLGFSSFKTFIGLILFISNLAITIRRLHDFNVSGWAYFFLNCFFCIITIYLMIKDGSIKKEVPMSILTSIFSYSTVILIYLILSLVKGSRGTNRYGEPPKY